MPTSGKQWFHLTIGTYGSWLPGDPRGFRERDHDLHSAGDHRHPPPPGEHAGLHRYARSISGSPTIILPLLRPVIGQKLVDHLAQLKHRLLVLAVAGEHVHALVELPLVPGQADHAVGRIKRAAALLWRKHSSARLWAGSCGLKPIQDRQHHLRTFAYIQNHARQNAWVWVFPVPPASPSTPPQEDQWRALPE